MQSTTTAAAAGLLQRARERGRVRLIVGLREPFVAESAMAASSAGAQRARIAASQQALLTALGGVRRTADASVDANGDKVTLFETIPFLALAADAATLQRLAADPRVASVVEDLAVRPTLARSVPLIKADKAAARGFTGNGQTVAILDTGVAKSHPMLKGKVVSEACYSSTVSGQSRSLCPGGVHHSTAAGSGKNCVLDGCEHGTHVASIAAGSTGSLKGVARGAKIIAIQVFSRSLLDASPTAYYSDIIAGLERVYALRNKYKIASANLSLGGGDYHAACDFEPEMLAVKAIIDNLRSAKIATVIASGNDGLDGFVSAPGCISTAVTVGSTTKSDKISSFSNQAKMVDLLAPGSDIRAAVPGGGYEVMSGTSMATPHVTGAWAILKQAKPNASVQEIQQALACTGVSIGRAGIKKPRIDVLAALNVLRSPAAGCH